MAYDKTKEKGGFGQQQPLGYKKPQDKGGIYRGGYNKEEKR